MKKRYYFTYMVEVEGEEEIENFETNMDILMNSGDGGEWQLDFVEDIKDDNNIEEQADGRG